MRQLLFLFGLLLYMPGFGQQPTVEQKRLIYFTDKASSPYSLERPLEFLSPKSIERRQRQAIPLIPRDLPVNPAYVAGLKEAGVTVWYTSRWFNAAVVQCSEEELAALQALPFVKGNRTLNRIASPTGKQNLVASQKLEAVSAVVASPLFESEDYGLAFHQADMLGADELHAAGFAGQGMTIAVFDAGFPGVNTIPAFSHLYQNNQLKGTFDFVRKQENVYSSSSHGTSVLATMAAFAPGKYIGTAYSANYLLLRTEDAASEHNIEEINWLLAAEYADSAGADVINSSLGYTTFDEPSVSYTYQDMNGNTTLVSKAADYAASTGILVVVSAGNDGNKPWQYISAPADADSVLAVGAVDSLGVRAPFSSFGPTADGQVKPDVVALGLNAYILNSAGNVVQANGTSFAGPIMAGFTTSLWQANLSKSNMEMIQLLRQLGSNYDNPNNSTGYGIPNYSRIVTSLPGVSLQERVYISNPVSKDPIIIALGQEWLEQPVEVQVLDATGKLIYRQSIQRAKAEQQLSLLPQQLQKGLYLCRIRSGSRAATLRFVKL
ncbi:S8 family serine peptidase [Pontibacter akesuensis]|uniref:Por secretion system C-terminal sorting domain-containing protein n=1 Tax=Pontibacter akesuensis TaxID=388950 RepID=A0A1I7G867_9BACT|nr:S8 family serine peptidase [Pontibacter akesuensis]GHA58214.1 serine protease [Pontibacter akesuensis]SFU44644.1 Por secretion system C-terminal sorting domain-containing protein [Pontibacter akesuensis]